MQYIGSMFWSVKTNEYCEKHVLHPREAPETNPWTGAGKPGPYVFQKDQKIWRVDQIWPGEQKRRATPGRSLLVNTGRDDWIRTSDPLLPKQVRYQAALHPVSVLGNCSGIFIIEGG